MLRHAIRTSIRSVFSPRMSSSAIAPTEGDEADPPPLKKLRREEESEGTEEEGEGVGHHDPSEGGQSPSGPAKASEVGITEFASDHEGFFAILKRRYSDFLVHELTPEGNVVRLKTYSVPLEDYEADGDEGVLVQFLGEDLTTSIRELSQSTDKEDEVQISIPLDKGQRTLVHKTVRTLYPLLESEAVELDGDSQKKAIVIRHSKKQTQGKAASGSRGFWPRERGSYCKFVLYKENKDTMEAVSVISRLLKIKSTCFHYAGLKDRRAVTSQYITAFKVPAEKFQAINPKLINMRLGNFEYTPNSLKLGDLAGNKFTVILRNVSCDDHVISKAVESLGELGFINYYGMQRFGTSAIPTHHVGRHLIHSDWKGAIDLILKPRPGDPEDVMSAREYYMTSGDVVGTLARMPKSRFIERQLLRGLEKHANTNNYLGALKNIPRNTRLIYVHSWQSYCWNLLASWRVKELGLTPALGDLVLQESSTQSEPKVQYVTEENIAEYSIHDVVLPLPGYDIQLPANGAKEEYERILTAEKVMAADLQNRVRDVALVGAFRHVVVKPKDLASEVLLYDDLTMPLALTDLDILAAKQPPQSLPGGSLKALKVEFSLPPSTYATMVIRELLKMDTSSSYQATLNDTVP